MKHSWPEQLQWQSGWTRCDAINDKKTKTKPSCARKNVPRMQLVWASHLQWVVDFESRLCDKVIIGLEDDSELVAYWLHTLWWLLPAPASPNYGVGLWLVLHFDKVIPEVTETRSDGEADKYVAKRKKNGNGSNWERKAQKNDDCDLWQCVDSWRTM